MGWPNSRVTGHVSGEGNSHFKWRDSRALDSTRPVIVGSNGTTGRTQSSRFMWDPIQKSKATNSSTKSTGLSREEGLLFYAYLFMEVAGTLSYLFCCRRSRRSWPREDVVTVTLAPQLHHSSPNRLADRHVRRCELFSLQKMRHAFPDEVYLGRAQEVGRRSLSLPAM